MINTFPLKAGAKLLFVDEKAKDLAMVPDLNVNKI
jgi:hypothetical protein